MALAEAIVGIAEIYAWLGLAVAIIFLLYGIDRIDPSARGAFAFRALAVPGVVLLWLVVLLRWRRLAAARAG